MRRLLLAIACGVAVGCGTTSTPPTLDAIGEQEYEQQQKQAAAAEGKGKPKKGEKNPADE